MIKNFFLTIIYFSFLLVFTNCEKEYKSAYPEAVEYIKYGTSFGECLGYCRKNISVTGSEITFHKSGWGFQEELPDISFTENIDAIYWNKLVQNNDFGDLLQLDSIIGCPDCADGGAEWIEIKKKKENHKIVFEYYNEPEPIRELIGYLRMYIHTFQVDSSEDVDFNERTLIERPGIIKNFVCSRGCYQYLIEINNENGTSYYIDNQMDKNFKKNDLKIRFSGVLDYDSTTIYKPAFNDIPIEDFKVRNLKIFDIKEISE